MLLLLQLKTLQQRLKIRNIQWTFLDLSKAFNIDCRILLFKLHHHGIRGLPYNCFSSYVRNSSMQQKQMENSHLHSKLIWVFLKDQY